MTRNNNILHHFNSGYAPDVGEYRHPPRPNMQDRADFGMSQRANPRTDPMARSQGQIRNSSSSHPTAVQSNGNGSTPQPRRRIPVAVCPTLPCRLFPSLRVFEYTDWMMVCAVR